MKKSSSIFFYCILAAIFLLPFGQLGRLQLTQDVSLHALDVVVGIIAVLWFGTVLLRKEHKAFNNILTLPIAAFISTSFISFVLAIPALTSGQLVASLLYLVRWGTYALIFYTTSLLSQKHKRQLMNSLLFSGIIFAFLGLVQYALYPNLRNLYYAGWDPHLSRLFSTFLDPNFAGIYLVLSIMLLVSWKREEKWFVPTLLLFCIVLLLTYSRSSYIAFLAGLLVIGLLKKAWKLLIGFVIVFAIGMLLLPRPFGEGVRLERTVSLFARVKNWSEAISVFQKYPVFGVGFNTYRYQRNNSLLSQNKTSHAGAGVDNSYLFVLATTGIVGFGAYLWVWIKIAQKSLKLPKTSMKVLRLSTIAAIFTHAFFINSLFYPWIMMWLWVLFGATQEA